MDLFDRIKKPASAEPDTAALHAPAVPPDAPLAERMRPHTLEAVMGHAERVGSATPLGRAILADRAPSLILWGPPGCGKTTLAKVVATYSVARFQVLSAVMAGIAEIRAVVQQAESERRAGRRTILFIDEIHRFNKAQQDALLPHVESGAITLIGATTENPSFALTSALLSRCQVVRLDPLGIASVITLLRRALEDREHGLGASGIGLEDDAFDAIARWADGDGRRALGMLEHVVSEVTARGSRVATVGDVEAAARDRTLRYDRDGEEHYNVISAFIKSMRGSDPDAAIYWCMRMIDAGEDPLFVLRRMVIFAAEDIGLADPRALEVAVAADQAFQRVGPPEGFIPLASAVTYLALAPKSRAAYDALANAREEIARSGALPVPLWLRNAHTAAMKAWGYGEGYRLPDGQPPSVTGQQYLPAEIADRVFYRPTSRGWEGRVAEYREKLRTAEPADVAPPDSAHQAARSVAEAVVREEVAAPAAVEAEGEGTAPAPRKSTHRRGG